MLKFNLKKSAQHKLLFHFQGQVELQGICAVFGDSGAGKTSFFRVLAGLDNTFCGSLECLGKTWQDNATFIKTEKRHIGMVFQEPRLFPHLDALGNLKLAMKKTVNSLYTIAELAALLDFEPLLNKKTQQLSGGQKQRIAIARAILTGPDLLLMDEPMSSLDQHSRELLLPFIKKLSERIPIIYITHSMQEVFYLSQKMILINQGEIESIGCPQSLFLNLDLSLAKHNHSGLIVNVQAVHWDDEFSVLHGLIDQQTILVAMEKPLSLEDISIKIESKDVILATQKLEFSSLQNCLRVRVEQIEHLPTSSVLLTLNTGNQKILAKITIKSLYELKLTVNQNIFAYIKAMSISAFDS
ncbi:molybdate ABC transporter, ATPase subunit [Psychromonas ingrahamii 37]|uniref:Molybdate ABC transporter, ATPase subunit n=1 Tax=Psychromonas ingrahamii (strain DSM 17664 / CCUG 51855 / 37) TaxID=357804 RepID=A1SWP0_PSYIN|nr:molybdenum ABC transporter ATP-binding protein [Psychromonas ingrahamii]ABM03905.1 molybdate ABC transporter, ATPase subunit [Psychromonas ingrahamii 37]